MSKSRALVLVLFSAVGVSSLSYAVTHDRVTGDLNSGPKVTLKGNVHGMARAEFDMGRADGNRMIQGVSLAFRPSAAQQKDLDQFISELADPNSPNFHKYLTPAQFGARFGMSQNDITKITSWLQTEGFTNVHVANGRNQITFDGTVAQIESTFQLEMHHYLVDGVLHLANAGDPSVPGALADSVLSVGNLNSFAPRPRAKIQSHFTSYVTGNHFLTPADFAKIYDLGSLYAAGGAGQKIAIVGQSTVNTADLNNFRSAAGLPASTVAMTLVGGTATRCSGDEGESDLDIEWSGGVAQNASIIFLYAGLTSGDSCTARNNSVWNALQYAVDNKVAPFISTSYGDCESGNGQAFAQQVQGWAQQGITQGQTIVAASGDQGAADCEVSTSTSATTGLAVDMPASIPEVTGGGGNEFTGDAAGTVTGNAPNTTAGATTFWGASGTGSDVISTAISYIPETAWNDTNDPNNTPPVLTASGGGASLYFSKPSWQTGTGVPSDGKRDVPDVSLSASNFHDPYLICSEDDQKTGTTVQTCTAGFRTGSGGNLTVVGGTSVVAPSFSAILALVNEYLGNPGIAPVNPTLYSFPGNSPSPFHDIISGNNEVPCSSGSTGCPSGTTQIGFSAGTGYDQVTGLGSVDAMNLATIWKRTPTTISVMPSPTSANLGTNITFTATVSPSSATGDVNFYNNGATMPLGSGALSGGTATFSTSSLPVGINNVTATYMGDTSSRLSATSKPAAVNMTTSFSVTANPAVATLTVAQGQTTAAVTLVVSSSAGFVNGSSTILPVQYSCSGLPAEAICNFSPGGTSQASTVSMTISTVAPTGRLQRPFDRGARIFYAMLLPGLLGVVITFSSRTRSMGTLRVLAVIALIGFGTLWTASCGGSSGGSAKNLGTPTGTTTVTVNATASSGSTKITAAPTVSFTLTVTQ